MFPGWKNITKRSQIESRIADAVSHLDVSAVAVRAIAIDSLAGIARDYPQHHWQIMKILAKFICDRCRPNFSKSDFIDPQPIIPDPQAKPSDDIQLALAIIGRRNTNYDSQSEIIDLSFADLHGADLDLGNFAGVNFYQVNFTNASLRQTNLQGAILSAANLSNANLEAANLESANLGAANLTQTNLNNTNLSNANLYLAKLIDTDLTKANLTNTNLNCVVGL